MGDLVAITVPVTAPPSTTAAAMPATTFPAVVARNAPIPPAEAADAVDAVAAVAAVAVDAPVMLAAATGDTVDAAALPRKYARNGIGEKPYSLTPAFSYALTPSRMDLRA